MIPKQREDTGLEEQPVAKTAVAEPPPKKEKKAKKKGQISISLGTELMQKLDALAGLWNESRYATAKKLLSGQVQHHYAINRCRGRL